MHGVFGKHAGVTKIVVYPTAGIIRICRERARDRAVIYCNPRGTDDGTRQMATGVYMIKVYLSL